MPNFVHNNGEKIFLFFFLIKEEDFGMVPTEVLISVEVFLG